MDDMEGVNNGSKYSKIQGITEHLKSSTLQRESSTDKCRIISFMGLYHMLGVGVDHNIWGIKKVGELKDMSEYYLWMMKSEMNKKNR